MANEKTSGASVLEQVALTKAGRAVTAPAPGGYYRAKPVDPSADRKVLGAALRKQFPGSFFSVG